jgi:hypothetical protein
MSDQLHLRIFLILIVIISILISKGNMINGLPFEEIVGLQTRKQCPPDVPAKLT